MGRLLNRKGTSRVGVESGKPEREDLVPAFPGGVLEKAKTAYEYIAMTPHSFSFPDPGPSPRGQSKAEAEVAEAKFENSKQKGLM